jgi:hypothetical protein
MIFFNSLSFPRSKYQYFFSNKVIDRIEFNGRNIPFDIFRIKENLYKIYFKIEIKSLGYSIYRFFFKNESNEKSTFNNENNYEVKLKNNETIENEYYLLQFCNKKLCYIKNKKSNTEMQLQQDFYFYRSYNSIGQKSGFFYYFI